MNGIQIEHLLRLIEEKTHNNNVSTRKEVVEYLRGHLQQVADGLADDGQFVIPTLGGEIRLTTEDLRLAVA